MRRWSFPGPVVLKPDSHRNIPRGLVKTYCWAPPHSFWFSCSGAGPGIFFNKFWGDAAVAGLGTQLGNHSLRHTSEQPLGFREISLALRTFEKKLAHLREYDWEEQMQALESQDQMLVPDLTHPWKSLDFWPLFSSSENGDHNNNRPIASVMRIKKGTLWSLKWNTNVSCHWLRTKGSRCFFKNIFLVRGFGKWFHVALFVVGSLLRCFAFLSFISCHLGKAPYCWQCFLEKTKILFAIFKCCCWV